METLLPRLRITLDPDGPLDPQALFPGAVEAVWLEIGYGGGEHLAAQAEAHRSVGFIGCEFFTNGIAKLLSRIEERELDNVRLYDGDAHAVLKALAPAAIDRAFLLFPDPWPKTRHHKRRFVQTAMLDDLARVMKSGGLFRVATDIPDYVRWTLIHLTDHPHFRWCDETPADWRHRKPDWPPTRYEQKALREGRVPTYLSFERL